MRILHRSVAILKNKWAGLGTRSIPRSPAICVSIPPFNNMCGTTSEDFVAVTPRRIVKGWPSGHAWWQPLYVDPITGLLCRTDRLAKEKMRRRARLNRQAPPIEHIALGKDGELRLINGQWYHVELAPLPEAEYRIRREIQTRCRHHYSARRGTYEVEVDVRRLVTPDVWDVVEKRYIPVGPILDDEKNWREYRRKYPCDHICRRQTHTFPSRIAAARLDE